ncbi:hypothetical protein [Azobacteroides phage ProJPt-Bp1]|uniref:Uncharacterized protein n=1 Tax=Azobacteroides phage ProJPt-Bp1 TaxID=1920526 RepID=A0A1V1FL16_9CAUD|nr:virion structural protein [Azobacteroides phage ProJPt-Bp1]BAX03427.1 hypothetical protein [Azobacteroides phage ProJPt-Bp1]
MTLNQIADDIILTAGYINKEKAMTINRLQLLSWIHMYRNIIMLQDLNDNSVIDPMYEEVFDYKSQLESFDNTGYVWALYKSEKELPKLPTLTGRFAISAVRYDNDLIDFGPELQARYNTNLFTSEIANAFLRNRFLYVKKFGHFYTSATPTFHVTMVTLADDTPEGIAGIVASEFDLPYPLPDEKIPRLKQMIFANELQWLLPTQGTAQSAQAAKLEDKETSNNPLDMMRMGGQLYEGID